MSYTKPKNGCSRPELREIFILHDSRGVVLPSGWRRVRLGALIRISASLVDPMSPEFADLPHVSAENIESGRSRLLYLNTAAVDGVTSGKYLFDPGDVLYSKLRPYLRKTIVADVRGVCSADMYPLKVDVEQLDPEFLRWLLLSDEFTAYADTESRRARMPKLNREQLFAWVASIPPLREQRRIASELAERLAAVEQARAAAYAQMEAAETLTAVYLREVFESDEARSWARRKLGECAVMLPAKSISIAGDKVVTTITTACLSEGGFRPEGVKQARMDSGDARTAEVGSDEILIARSNTPNLVGRVSRYEGHPAGVVANDLVIRVRCDPELLNPAFAERYLAHLFVSGYWRDRAGGASGSMKKITRAQLAATLVPCPPMEAQRSVIQELAGLIGATETLLNSLAGQNAEIEALPSAFLREAFAGRL